MAVTLQNCLDKIGYAGTPTTSLADLNSLSEKFAMKCPFSTLHMDGTIFTDEVEAMDRVITEGIGGTCVALSATFKFILDEIGFTSKYVSLSASGISQSAIIVTIGADDWVLVFGYYHQKICKPLKLEDAYLLNHITVTFNDPDYTLTNDITGFELVVSTTGRPISDWVTYATDKSTNDFMINVKMMTICVDPDSARVYNTGIITDYDINGDGTSYDYTDEDLVALFNYSGTV